MRQRVLPIDIVGGDYYAIQPLDSNRYGFLLADMEGHGVAAALYTMQLSILWKRHYQLLKSPAAFAEMLAAFWLSRDIGSQLSADKITDV